MLIEKDIGAHHIIVVEADDQKSFLAQVQAYVGRNVQGGGALFTEDAIKVVQAYLDAGFRYFAFDIQKVHPDLKVKEALAYRFESEWVYYPLLVSRIGGTGDTKVQLFVISPDVLNQYKGLKDDRIASTDAVELTPADLKKIDPKIAEVMGTKPAKGRIWTITGKLDGFDADLFARHGRQ